MVMAQCVVTGWIVSLSLTSVIWQDHSVPYLFTSTHNFSTHHGCTQTYHFTLCSRMWRRILLLSDRRLVHFASVKSAPAFVLSVSQPSCSDIFQSVSVGLKSSWPTCPTEYTATLFVLLHIKYFMDPSVHTLKQWKVSPSSKFVMAQNHRLIPEREMAFL